MDTGEKRMSENASCFDESDLDAPVTEYVTAGYRARWVSLTVGVVTNIAVGRWVQHKHSEQQEAEIAPRALPEFGPGGEDRLERGGSKGTGFSTTKHSSHANGSSVPASTAQVFNLGNISLYKVVSAGSIH